MKNRYEVDRDSGKDIRADGLTHAKALRQKTQRLNQDGSHPLRQRQEVRPGLGLRAVHLQITEDAGRWAEASALYRGGPGGVAPSPNVADI